MQRLKGFILPALSLFLVCLASSLLLSATHGLTKQAIEESENLKLKERLITVMPGSEQFSAPKEYSTGRGEPYIYYDAFNSSEVFIGRVLITSSAGYGGMVKAITGVDTNGEVTGVSIAEMNETPGLGAKITDSGFLSQFRGLSKSKITAASKNTGASLGQTGLIDAITGATVSSGAVSSAVNTAVEINVLISKGENK